MLTPSQTRLLLVGLLLLASAAAGAEEPAVELRPISVHARRAAQLFLAGMFEQAATEYEAAYLDTSDAQLIFQVGNCHRLAGHWLDAARAYDMFVKEQPAGRDRLLALHYLEELRRLHGVEPASVRPLAIAPRPEATPAPVPPPPPPPPPPPAWADVARAPPPARGFSLGAGIYGLVASAAVLSLGTAAELTRQHQVPSLPLGIAGTTMLTLSGPIAAAGSSSTRRATGVRGSLGLRVSGWVFYALSLNSALSLVALGALRIQPPLGLISGTTVLGTLGCTLLSAESLLVHAQAARSRPERGPTWSAGVTPIAGGAMTELAARF